MTVKRKWVREDVVLAIHDTQISEHGGRPGIRDLGLVQSALSRPVNIAHYGKSSIAEIAAAHAYGLAKNHGFVDGNKRTAYVVALVFLLDNGYEFLGEDTESVIVMVAVACGALSEKELARWFSRNIRRSKHHNS